MKMSQKGFARYLEERKIISDESIDRILEHGKRWSLGSILSKGGSALFPHTYLSVCGHQVAAVVQGCLDSGADQVVVLGVLHGLTDELLDARKREFMGENIENERSFGVLGPGVGGDTYWKGEFSLLNFHFLWDGASGRSL